MKLCKLDVAKVVLDKIYDDHMRGREIFSRLTDDTFRLVKVTPAKDRKATHRDQAFAIINRLITDLKEEWGNTIFVIPYEDDGEFGPIDIKISVYDLAIDKLYHSIPEEARLEPVNEHYFFDDPALDQQALAEEWNLQIAKPIVETPTTSVKPGVPELFESNPELANSVYSKILTNSGLSAENLLSFLLKDNLIEKQCS